MRAQHLILALGLAAGAVGGIGDATAAPARSTCKSVKDGVKLVPEGANAILQIDGAKAFRSQAWKDLRATMERDLEFKEGIAVLEKCGVGPSDVQKITVGIGSGDKGVATIKGKNLGSSKTLACVSRGIAARNNGKVPWTVSRDGCVRVLSSDGAEIGYALDDSTVVFTNKGWGTQVRELIAGKGHKASSGSLKGEVARVNKGRTLWFAGQLDDTDRSQLGGSAAADLQSFGGSVDVSRGMSLWTALTSSDPGGAIQLRDELIMYQNMARTMGGAMVPPGVLDKLKISASGNRTEVSMALSATDMQAIRRALEQATGGSNPI